MQIRPISFHSWNHKAFNLEKSQRDGGYTQTIQSNGIYPKNFSYSKDISFQQFDPNTIKNMRGVPCLCCGVKMIPYREYTANFNAKTLSGSAKDAVKLLSRYRQNMHKTERVCLKRIRAIALKNPSKTLQEIVMDLRHDALKTLQSEQLWVLDKIEAIGKKKLSEAQLQNLTEFLNAQRAAILNTQAGEERFKRKKFLSKLRKVLDETIPPKVRQQIMNMANRLNNSKNDFNAFIVKYSERSSTEIGQKLVRPSAKTNEHFVARKSVDGTRGTDDAWNVGYTCQRCNGEDKGNITLSDWASAQRRMSKHKAQAYFDFFLDQISKGRIPVEYISTLYRQAQTLISKSGGKIKIDTTFRRLTDKAA